MQLQGKNAKSVSTGVPSMNDAALREQVLYLLNYGGAHLDFDKAVKGLPGELRGAKPPNIPHSPWDLVAHMRICQWDILEFSNTPVQWLCVAHLPHQTDVGWYWRSGWPPRAVVRLHPHHVSSIVS